MNLSKNFIEKVILRIRLIGFDFGGFFTDKTVIVIEKRQRRKVVLVEKGSVYKNRSIQEL